MTATSQLDRTGSSFGLRGHPVSGPAPAGLDLPGGPTRLRYHLIAVEDLHAWLIERGDWVDLGASDEKKSAAAGTVEGWGRAGNRVRALDGGPAIARPRQPAKLAR